MVIDRFAMMVRLRKQGGPFGALYLLPLAALLGLLPPSVSAQRVKRSTNSGSGGMPHFNAFRVMDDIEGIDSEASAEWMMFSAHQPLLKLALPATYMSTLTDVNRTRYFGKVEAQDRGVAHQLKDGIRLLDVRLWRAQKASEQSTGWFTEVPWRLFEDAEVLRGNRTPSPHDSLSSVAAEALEVHSRTDLVEGVFKPVLQFLRKSLSEVIVVVFSAINGNVHTIHNMISKGSELAESLSHAKTQLSAFLRGGGPYSYNEHHDVLKPADTSTTVRIAPQSAYRSPLLEGFVRKSVSFSDFAEVTGLIDNYWGQLLPRHKDKFSDTNKEQRPMVDSLNDPEAFRQWQRDLGTSLLAKPISELRDENVRLILLVDDPLLAWFITTRSHNQVVAFVKADHLYDVSYKSESHFVPCASPHTSLLGKPNKSQPSIWQDCRSLCISEGPEECSSWVWKPDQSLQSSASGSSRHAKDLGIIWEEKAGEEPGQCELFTTARPTLSFEAIVQEANCSVAEVYSSDLPWTPEEVYADLLRSVLPTVHVETRFLDRRSMSKLPDIVTAFDPRVSLLTTGHGSGHETKYGTSQKLIRILFAPPTPQVRIEAVQRSAHSSPSDVPRMFNAMLAEYLLRIIWIYHALEREGIGIRVVNAIQISKYHRIRSNMIPFTTASFFQHMMVLNPSSVISPHLFAFSQGSFGYFLGDPGADAASRTWSLETGSLYMTMWMCFLGVVIGVSLLIFLSTFWCRCHPGSLFRKLCHRRANTAGPPIAAVEVVGIPGTPTSHSVTAA